MADERYRDSGVCVEFLFEGEDAEGLRESATDDAYAPGAPGPELRADVVDVLNAAAFEFAGEAQVEAGEIGQDGEGRLAALGFTDEATHGAYKGRETAQDLGDADNGELGAVGDAGGAHLRAAHAENCDVGAPLERGGETRGVHISASFTGGNQKRDGRHAAGKRSVAGGEGQWQRGAWLRTLRVVRQVELLLFVLQLIEAVVDAALAEQLLMGSLFAEAALV